MTTSVLHNSLLMNTDTTETVCDELVHEEALQMIVNGQDFSITMQTPGHELYLVRGLLHAEGIHSEKFLDFKIERHETGSIARVQVDHKQLLNSGRRLNSTSSCGVCGKSSLDALEIIKKNKTNSSEPKITKETVILSPKILQENQSEFSKTGGIHASGLFSSNGELVNLREDVGRHNALDKLIGNALINDQLNPKTQFITCSGRLNFELVQKVLMTDIGIMIGVGAPTSLAIDLANKFDITLIGFVKRDSFNIYTNNKKVIVD